MRDKIYPIYGITRRGGQTSSLLTTIIIIWISALAFLRQYMQFVISAVIKKLLLQVSGLIKNKDIENDLNNIR